MATEQERTALLREVPSAAREVGPYQASVTAAADVLVSGIGPAAAAACTAAALALGAYDGCLSLGICGAFRGTAAVGDLVVATELVAADLGADAPGGFLGLGALGWDDDTAPADERLRDTALARLRAATGVADVVTGPVLTVSTVTGTRARADELSTRHGAVAEAMEGWGVFEAARVHRLPVLEVRTVSNLVGDRDTTAWDFPAAFAALATVGTALLGDAWA